MPGEARKFRPGLVRMALRAVLKMKLYWAASECAPTAANTLAFVAVRRLYSSSYLFGASLSRFSRTRRISPSSISFFKLT